MSGRLRLGAGIDHPIDALAIYLLGLQCQGKLLAHHSGQEAAHRRLPAVAYMMAVMVAPLGLLSSASTVACLGLTRVLEWTTVFARVGFDRAFAPDGDFAIVRS